MANVLGLGGIFFKSQNPSALKKWYVDNLGVPAGEDAGISFPNREQSHHSYTVLGPFRQDTEYFLPSKREFMINLVVDDVEGVLAKARAAGAEIVGEIEQYEYGWFGWFIDPDGNKIELWQPPGT